MECIIIDQYLEKETLDINWLYERMKPTLRSMEQHREAVISKFRPLLMVFAGYTMICFLIPYMDFGIPRGLRGNMFYFLLTIGLLSFSVITAIYYRAFKEIQVTIYRQFYQGLSMVLGKDFEYKKEITDDSMHMSNNFLGLTYNHLELKNLIKGEMDGMVFSFVQARAEQRLLDPLRTDKRLFEGLVFSLELTLINPPTGLIVGKKHPFYEKYLHVRKPLVLSHRREIAAKYFYLAGDQTTPGNEFVTSLINFDEQLTLERITRQDLILTISDNRLTVSIPLYDRLWELVNWKPIDSLSFLNRQMLPFTGAWQLANDLQKSQNSIE